MSSNLPALTSLGELVTGRNGLPRRTAQELDRIYAAGLVATARESARVDAIASVTESALMATSHISAVEALLVSRTPHAEVRLRHIADAGCTGMASVVLGLNRRV